MGMSGDKPVTNRDFRLSENELKGNLSVINLADIIQFLSASEKIGELRITRETDGRTGRLYFANGNLVSVYTDTSKGLEGLAEIIEWDEGEFKFASDIMNGEKNVDLPSNHAILKAVSYLDEQSRKVNAKTILRPVELPEIIIEDPLPTGGSDSIKDLNMADHPIVINAFIDDEHEANHSRSKGMSQQQRESIDILSDLLKVVGVDAVVVIGRDGFVIDTAGSSARLNIDELGASLAHAVSALEEMGSELAIGSFRDLFVEYGSSVILCQPVGDAVAAVLTPDASRLGIIRHKIKNYIEELSHLF